MGRSCILLGFGCLARRLLQGQSKSLVNWPSDSEKLAFSVPRAAPNWNEEGEQ